MVTKQGSSFQGQINKMITSSDFFRKSFFQPEEKTSINEQEQSRGKKESIDPWRLNQEIPWEMVNKGHFPERLIKLKKKKQTSQSKEVRRDASRDVSSNLFQSKSPTQLPHIAASPYLLPSPAPFMVKNSLSNFHQRRQRQENRREKARYEQISIHQFLSQKRKELTVLQQKSPQKKQLPVFLSKGDQFLMKRNSRKAYFKQNQSKTLNLKKQLQIFERKSIVSLSNQISSSQKMPSYGVSERRYKPLKSERYHL